MSMDMHCHLDLYPEPFKVAEECRRRRVYVLSVTTTPKAWEGTKRLEEYGGRIRTALGLHPQLAHLRYGELDLFDAILPEVKYVGEIGLDGGKGFKEHWQVQLKVFRHILNGVNNSGGKIMTVHSRHSTTAVLDELEKSSGIPILHWFTGTKRELRRAIDMGCWFSVGPAMLNSKKGWEIVSCIPRDRLLTETDGPFAKFARKPLMPWESVIVDEQLVDLWGESAEDVAYVLHNNLKVLVSQTT